MRYVVKQAGGRAYYGQGYEDNGKAFFDPEHARKFDSYKAARRWVRDFGCPGGVILYETAREAYAKGRGR